MEWDPGEFETVDDTMAAVLRTKTGAERVKIANDMFVSMRKMLMNVLRSQHPDWDEQQVVKETSRRLLSGSL